MARVNNRSPRAFLNSLDQPCLIDANFSTFLLSDGPMTPEGLLALLNSTWTRACMEVLGTPMGGGALKIEAAQLRTLLVPQLEKDDIDALSNLGRNLSSLPLTSDISRLIKNIDARLYSKLSVNLGLPSDQLEFQLNSIIVEFLGRRNPDTL